ncbi:MAG: CCDC90 family protein [Desulfovibrionaceae bacterium]|jgi:hypothetical protein|nr:CCDC90 family protein [Desulfovibrionaceae bacterium]
MTALTFDTLKYANTLKAAGFTPEQAEAQAGALSDVMEVNLKELVTKADLHYEIELLRKDMAQLEQRIIIKLGSMLVVSVGVIVALIKLL